MVLKTGSHTASEEFHRQFGDSGPGEVTRGNRGTQC